MTAPQGGESAQLADVHQIEQTLYRYAIALDTLQLDLFDDVFAPDARIQLQAGRFESRDAYRDHCRQVLPGLDATHHLMASPTVDVVGDRATAHSYYLAQHAKNALSPAPFFLIGGWNDDELARIDGRWLITYRTGTPVWFDGNPGVVGFDVPVAGHRPPPPQGSAEP